MATLLRTIQQFSDKSFLKTSSWALRYGFFPRISVHSSSLLFGVKPMEIKMPSLSPTMTEGTIVKWMKKEGDTVAVGDILCDIQTDKAVVALEVEEDGILAKILIPEDTKDVKIGTLIALVVESGQDYKNVEIPASTDQVSTSISSESPAQSGGVTYTGGDLHGIEIKMPSLSPTMTEGTIVKWMKNEGDTVSAGDVLCEIQTDKAVVALEVEDDGILAKILVPENTKDIKLGTLIALMVEPGQDYKNVAIPVSSPMPSTPVSHVKKETPAKKIPSKRSIGPAVRLLLHHFGLTAEKIEGSGPNGRILKYDVRNYIERHKLKPGQAKTEAESLPSVKQLPIERLGLDGPDYIDIPLTNIRRVIAKRLTESKTTIPHAYCSIDCDINEILNLRKKIAAEGRKVSVNDFIIKASAVALQRVPEVNAVSNGGISNPLSDIDVSVAVATDTGLITPIVKDAINLGITEIADKVQELAGRARHGKLKPHEFQGGSFSISNLGMFGISNFAAVINPPQGAILAIGSSRIELGADNKMLTNMTVTLSFDNRIIGEEVAFKFLQTFKEVMETPMMMLLQPPALTSLEANVN